MSVAIFTILGILLLLLVYYDIYATILRATKHTGPVSGNLNRTLWQAAKSIAKKLPRRRRHRLLNAIGPLLLPLLFGLFITFLIVGFALIYLPRMETEFYQSDEARVVSRLMQAVYFSGVTLVTLGYGDIVPRSGGMRMLSMVEALTGIALVSLAVTYLLTVYGALERKRAVALNFYHQAAQGADVASFITRHFAREKFYGLTDELKIATRELQELLETHIEHPVIHYFHPLEVYKSLPRALFVVLEAVSLLHSTLNREKYVESGDHPDVMTAGENARYVLAELITALNLQEKTHVAFESQDETLDRRKRSYQRAVEKLSAAKIEVRSDAEKSFQEYSAERERWERQLYYFADFSGYDWDEISGDRDLEDAADDEIIERHKPLEVKK
jgi:hypothetical protein